MDFDNILYVEYLSHNNYKKAIILFLKGCKSKGQHLDVRPLGYNILNIGLKSLALMTATFFEWNMKETPRRYFFCGSFMFFLSVFAMPLCVSVYMCLVVTCWKRADPLALVCDV